MGESQFLDQRLNPGQLCKCCVLPTGLSGNSLFYMPRFIMLSFCSTEHMPILTKSMFKFIQCFHQLLPKLSYYYILYFDSILKGWILLSSNFFFPQRGSQFFFFPSGAIKFLSLFLRIRTVVYIYLNILANYGNYGSSFSLELDKYCFIDFSH